MGIHNWFLNKRIEHLGNAISKIEKFFEQASPIWHDKHTIKDLKNLEEDLSVISATYRSVLHPDDDQALQDAANIIEILWRSYNARDTAAYIREKNISSNVIRETLQHIQPIIANLQKISEKGKLILPKKSALRESKLGIWDENVSLALYEFHKKFKDLKYAIVGGVAIQVYVARLLKDVKSNKSLMKKCRPTHDIDVIFPEGTSSKEISERIKGMHTDSSMLGDELLYSLKISRLGAKRPIIVVDTGKKEEIPLNITTTFKDAIGQDLEGYKETFNRIKTLEFVFQGEKITVNVISPEDIIRGKAQRLANKDLYDISLILQYCNNLDFDYLERTLNHETFLRIIEHLHPLRYKTPEEISRLYSPAS